jgi:hypothetical protein
MSKIYFHLIKTYVKESKKLVEDRLSKHDMVVIEDIKPAQSGKSLQSAFEYINTFGTSQRQ